MSLAGILWLLEASLIIANLWNLKLFTIGEVCKTLDCTPWKLTRISEKLLVGSGWNFLLRWSRISGDIPSFLLPGCNSDRIILLTTVRRSYTRLRKFLVKHLDPLMGSFVYIYIYMEKKRKRGLCLNMLELSTSCSTNKNWGWSWTTPTCVALQKSIKLNLVKSWNTWHIPGSACHTTDLWRRDVVTSGLRKWWYWSYIKLQNLPDFLVKGIGNRLW